MKERDKKRKQAFNKAVEWLVPMLRKDLAAGEFETGSDFVLQTLMRKLLEIELHTNPFTGLGYYAVTEEAALPLVAMTAKSSPAFALAASIAASNVLAEKPLPEPLRIFAGNVLLGRVTAPSGRKGRKREWNKNFMLYAYAKTVEAEFDLPLTRNEVSPPHSACDAMAVALERVGYEIEADAIKQRCVSKQFYRVREYYHWYEREVAKVEKAEPSAG